METFVRFYQLGHLTFSIEGNEPILPYLFEELRPIEITGNAKPDLRFIFTPPPHYIERSIHASPVICTPEELKVEDRSFTYHLKKKGEVSIVKIASKPTAKGLNRFPKLRRLLDWNYLLPLESLAKTFMYSIFDYITQIVNLEQEQSYFHASAFSKGDQGVAVIAWGGVGKTTSMLKLVTEDQWRFLSDDLGIIDSKGWIYRSPKKMQIYAYNIENQSVLRNILLKGRTMGDRLNWYEKRKLHGPKRARRRVSAEELFTKKGVSRQAKLTTGLFIERAAVADFETHKIAPESLAKRAATTVMDEINPYQKIQNAVYSVMDSAVIPDYQTVFRQTKTILEQAFSNAELYRIKIPLKANPDELANYLRKILN